jgi:hypothetical protein
MPVKYYRGTYELKGRTINSKHTLCNVPEDYSPGDAAAVIQAQHPEMRNLRVVEIGGPANPTESQLLSPLPPAVGTGAHGIPGAVGEIGVAPNIVQPELGRVPLLNPAGTYAKEPQVPMPTTAASETAKPAK